MKKGAQLPEDHHVMRHVPWSRLRRDADENVIGILPHAFELREGESALSVNWVEFHAEEGVDPEVASIQAFRRTLDIRNRSAFGIGNVKEIADVTDERGRSLRTTYSPNSSNQSHSSIKGRPLEDEIAREKLAVRVFERFIKNSDVDS